MKDAIPIRTWAQWDDAVPGFAEIDLVGHEGGNAIDDHCYTLTVTDIAIGWTSEPIGADKAEKWVLAALVDIQAVLPFPLLGVDSANGGEFINWHLLRWCKQQMLTFTRSRPGNSNDGAHVEQKSWAVVRTIVGYLRYDTTPELLLSNQIWKLQSLMTNLFYPQQKLVSKVRNGAKVTKTYDRLRTPMFPADAHHGVAAADKSRLAEQYADLNPAAIQRQIQGLTAQLLALATGKGAAARRPDPKRASADQSTTTSKRTS